MFKTILDRASDQLLAKPTQVPVVCGVSSRRKNFIDYFIYRSRIFEDFAPRVNCVRWFFQQDLNFLSKMLFTDEAAFSRDGVFNFRNRHVWAFDYPREIAVRHHQHKCSVNVWSGILNYHVIGTYILTFRLTSLSYLVFLKDVLPELFENITLANLQDIWFQHDGALAHFFSKLLGST